MVFGELAPKNLAIARTVAVARALSRSTLLYLSLAGPVVRMFDLAPVPARAWSASIRSRNAAGAAAEELTRIIDESR